MAKIIVKPGTPQAQEYELKPGKNYLGRGFANDFKLEDASVSGSHALIEVNGGVTTITDLGSTNGTRVNQLPATGNPLQSGQMLKLGAVELLYLADAAAPALPSVAPPAPPSAAAQIATEFVIRDPSRVGIVPPAPAPPPPTPVTAPGTELRIPGVTPSAPPPPAPIRAAEAMPISIPASTGIKVPEPAPRAPAPAPEPVMVAAAAPAPIPVGGGMKLAGITHAPAPAPVMAAPAAPVAAVLTAEPVAGPAAATDLMEAPPGKIACKFHKTTPGQWLCQKCEELFCSLCVSTRPTPAGAGYFCRACGTQCVPVKIKALAKKKEKQLVAYSDGTIVLRTIGFGVGGAVVAGGVWAGFTALTAFDMPAIFAPLTGVLCGYAVKVASQDRPGGFFSAVAVAAALLGIVIGLFGAILITHHFLFTINSLAMGVFGVLLGLFAAWKVGGGDF